MKKITNSVFFPFARLLFQGWPIQNGEHTIHSTAQRERYTKGEMIVKERERERKFGISKDVPER